MTGRDIAPDWISVAPADVPRVTGVAESTVRGAITSGELEVLYPTEGGQRQIVTRDALLRWLASMPNERPISA